MRDGLDLATEQCWKPRAKEEMLTGISFFPAIFTDLCVTFVRIEQLRFKIDYFFFFLLLETE